MDIQNTITATKLNIHTNYTVGKELAFFIYGHKSSSFVDPMLLDNIDYLKIIQDYSKRLRIPRYRSLEQGPRIDEIPVRSEFENPNPETILSSKGYKFGNNEFTQTKSIFLVFPCLISLKNIKITFRGLLGNWTFSYVSEETGTEINLINIQINSISEIVNGWNIDKVLKNLRLIYKGGFVQLQQQVVSYISRLEFETQTTFYIP